MKKSPVLFVGATLMLALFLIIGITIPAQAKNGGGGKKQGAPDVPTDTRTLVQSVDTANQTVTLITMANNSVHTYKIDIGTTITMGSNPATFTAIKPGMEALSYQERDAQYLDSISVGPATPAPPSATKPNKKKKNAGN